MKAALRLIVLVGPLAGLAACSNVHARTPAVDAALLTPVPPAHVIVPVTIVVPEPDPPQQPQTPPKPNPPASKPPDRPTQPVQPPATPPVEPPVTAAPAPVLQTASNLGDTELKINGLIAKAKGDLSRVNPRTLGADARAQYDTATGFIRQAEDAIRGKNLPYAKELADKAVALAGLLVR